MPMRESFHTDEMITPSVCLQNEIHILFNINKTITFASDSIEGCLYWLRLYPMNLIRLVPSKGMICNRTQPFRKGYSLDWSVNS